MGSEKCCREILYTAEKSEAGFVKCLCADWQTNQSANQPDKQPTNQPTDQPTNQPTDQPTQQPPI